MNKTELSFMRRYVTWITSHPWWVIAVISVVTALLATQLGNLHIDIDPDRSLPKDHPLVVLGDRITAKFGGKYMVAMGVEVKDGTIYNKDTLSKVKRLTDQIAALPGVIPTNILSLTSSNVKYVVGTSDGMQVDPVLIALPDSDQEMAALRDRVKSDHMLDGLLVSKDETMTMVLVDFADIEQAGGFSGVYEKIRAIVEPEEDDHTQIHLAGLPINVYSMEQYSGRMRYVFPIAIAVIALLLFVAFRTVQGMAIPLLTAILSVVWSMGLLGFMGWGMDPFNLMTPILILAVAAGHSVQILKRYYEEYRVCRNSRQAVIEATTRIGVAMLTAGFVAAVGFASLMTFQTRSIQSFGLLSAFGILSALTIEMTFIPALRTLLRPPTDHQMSLEGRATVFDPFLRGVTRLITKGKSAWVFIALAMVVCLSIVGFTRIKIDNSLSAFFSSDTKLIRDLQTVNQKGSGAFVVQVLVEGDQEDALTDPKVLQDMDRLGKFAEGLPGVGKVVSLVDFMKKMNRAMNEDNPEFDVVPGSPDLIAGYLLLYSMSGDPGDFDRVVDFKYQSAVITIYESSDSYEALSQLKTQIDDYVDRELSEGPVKYSVGGGITNGIALSEVVIEGKIQNIAQVCSIILLISALVLGSLLGGFLVLLPLAVALLANLGVMGFAGVRMSVPTATISAMVLGIGADYAIYFIFRYREELKKGRSWAEGLEAAEAHSGKAILYVATSIAFGYATLCLTGFLIHIYLGSLVPITMVFSSVAALTVTPGIIYLVRPKFLAKHIPPGAAASKEQ